MRRNTKTMYEWRKACADKVVCKRVYEVERILLN